MRSANKRFVVCVNSRRKDFVVLFELADFLHHSLEPCSMRIMNTVCWAAIVIWICDSIFPEMQVGEII